MKLDRGRLHRCFDCRGVWLERDAGSVHGTRLLLGWAAAAGGTWSSAARIR